MEQTETFRANLLKLIDERNLSEAEVSLAAGLNRRAVTDIRERRTRSPKISTVFSLASALNVDAGELLGLKPRYQLQSDLAKFLQQYDEEDQARFLAALLALPRQPSE